LRYLLRKVGWVAALALAAEIAISCAGTKPTVPLPAEEKFRQAIAKFEKRKFEDAKMLFESVIFDSPGSVVADSAQYMVGMCYYQQKEYELAAGEFQRFFIQYPSSPLVDDAELMRARCYGLAAPKNTGLDQHYTQYCVDLIRAFKDDHPTSDLLPAADSLLLACWERLSRKDFKAGKLYYRMGAHKAAAVYFQLLLDEYPDSPLVPETIFIMAESYRRREIYDTAIIWYEKLVYLHPDAPITAKAKKRIAKLQPLLPAPLQEAQGQTP